ncbi:MAG: hypothetical protein AAF560_27825 [Acidobacteriota bacterium]
MSIQEIAGSVRTKPSLALGHIALLTFAALLTNVTLLTSSLAAGPTGQGDTCADPIPAVTGTNDFDSSNFNSSEIPLETGGCAFLDQMDWDVWYRTTFPSDGLVKISSCAPGSFETIITVYRADGGCQALSMVENGGFVDPDASCEVHHSENFFVATGGTEYLFRVAGEYIDQGGPAQLNLEFTPQNNPCNCPPGDPNCPTELVAANPFPIPGSIEVETDGIFAIWWDGDFSHAMDTATMFSRLATTRSDSLDLFGMQDPPSPDDCLYYNIYIHHNEDDDFPDWWGNGQGTDGHCRPYLTLPEGAHLSESNLFHEAFHIFQYNSDSPGFELDDTYWYIEATAQWYMSTKIPEDDVAFIEAGAIIANPQLALWHAFDNGAPDDPIDWYYQVRQYGMHTLLFYLTEHGVSPGLIPEGFYGDNPFRPQEFLYSRIGATTFRRLFADWAAENTAGLIYLTPGQVQRALDEANAVGDPTLFNPYVADVTASQLEGGWVWQACADPSCYRPRSWAYNVIRIANTTAGQFGFQLDGDATGSEGAGSHFEGRIVILGPDGPRFETLNMTDAQNGQHTTFVDADVTEVFVVVASVPEHFTGNQTYGYTLNATFSPGAVAIFQDDFESGDTGAWSSSVP